MSRYAKGCRNEHKSRRLLESRGYYVIRAAGSHGLWDLVAIATSISAETIIPVLLVQVKTNRSASKVEVNAMAGLELPIFCKKMIHVWRDRQAKPQEIEVK